MAFDKDYYNNTYQDVSALGVNPFEHYMEWGWKEGRNPSPTFDSAWYLEQNEDVRSSGVNPFVHYVTWGRDEGRLPQPPRYGPETKQDPYSVWCDLNGMTSGSRLDLEELLSARFGRLPRISFVTPVYNTDAALLRLLVSSVLAQVYDDWELCLVDDASSSGHVGSLLDELGALDERIRVIRLQANGGISEATNAGVTLASGPVVAFLDHDDLITPDCAAELAIYYADHPDADMVYSDDDKIDMEGRRYSPQFKPDWAPVLLLSYMYMSHIFSVRKELFERLGGFRKDFDGAQDYDFALRASECARHVGHIPKVLYHWRAAPGSTASSADTKPASLELGRRAVREAVERRGLPAEVVHPDWAAAAKVGMFELRFVDDGPSVTLIIPLRNKVHFLKACLESLEKTTYRNYDILVVDNESDEPETLDYLAGLEGMPRIRVVKIANPDSGFSYAYVNNQAVRHTQADYVLFLNNDTSVISPQWLSQMMGYARIDAVGAVGARLYFEDGTIQHAGIVHGYHEGLVGHAFRNKPPYDWGTMGFIRTSREYSGVTAACLLTSRALFQSLGGFDEVNFAVAYNDVDYCYRVVSAGRSCIYCSTAELYHYEGKTRGFNDNPKERVNLRRLWGDWNDRWYNPNLSLENEDFEPSAARPATTRLRSVRVVAVSHNLNYEGAPITFCDLMQGLKATGGMDITIVSPEEGPLRAVYENAGIRVIVTRHAMAGVTDGETFTAWIGGMAMLFEGLEADVIVANTLRTFWAVQGARAAGIGSLWCQHESEPWPTYFNYLPASIRPFAYRSFADAYRVLYVAEATRRAWRELDTRGNFKIIRHGIPPERLAAEITRYGRVEARSRLGVEKDDIVVSVVGTVCERKGQEDLVKAFALIDENIQTKLRIFIAGRLAEHAYHVKLKTAVSALSQALQDRVVITDEIEDPFLYYSASDIFVCTSRIESAPRVLVEAMACQLPIITTPVFGIPELVARDVNALFYDPADIKDLAAKIQNLASDPIRRSEMAQNSKHVLDAQPGFNDMVQNYAIQIKQAANLA